MTLPSNGGPYLDTAVFADMYRDIQRLKKVCGIAAPETSRPPVFAQPPRYRPRRRREVTEAQHQEICELYAKHMRIIEIARRMEFSPQTIINRLKAAGVHRQRRVA